VKSEKSLNASPHKLIVNEPAHEPVHEPVHKPVHEPVHAHVHEPVHAHVLEPVDKPVQSRPPTAPKRLRTGKRKDGLAAQTLTINANTLHPDTARFPDTTWYPDTARFPGYLNHKKVSSDTDEKRMV